MKRQLQLYEVVYDSCQLFGSLMAEGEEGLLSSGGPAFHSPAVTHPVRKSKRLSRGGLRSVDRFLVDDRILIRAS